MATNDDYIDPLDDDENLDDDESSTNESSASTESKDDGSVEIEETTGASEDDEGREKIREHRRQERQDRKTRSKEKDERLRRELSSEREARRDLEARLAVIERKSSGTELAQIEGTIKQTTTAYAFHKDQLAKAYKDNNGLMAAEATEKMMLAKQRIDDLGRIKDAFNTQAQTAAPLDRRLVDNANSFMEKNSWYKPDGKDTDSAMTRTLDNGLAQEGWDPKSSEYWEELNARVKKYLPHRSNRGTVASTDTPKPRSVVSGSGGESGSSGNPGTFKLSGARVQALKDAGMWEDPAQRADAVKRYKTFDQQNKNGR
jgi:hypothetical protein